MQEIFLLGFLSLFIYFSFPISDAPPATPGLLSFTGIPVSSFESGSHMRKLVMENSYRLVICDQFPASKPSSGKAFERRISRIITPGTISEESILTSPNNNFLLSIINRPDTNFEGNNMIGLSWIDISTGDMSSASCTIETIDQHLIKLAPKEIILESKDEQFLYPIIEMTSRIIGNKICITKRDVFSSLDNGTYSEIISKFTPKNKAEEESLVNLIRYVKETQLEGFVTLFNSIAKPDIQHPPLYTDSKTFRSLEILTCSQTGKESGSLLGSLNMSKTAIGARFLTKWLRKYFPFPSYNLTNSIIYALNSLFFFLAFLPFLS